MKEQRNRKGLPLPDRRFSRPVAAGEVPQSAGPPVDPIVEKAALLAWNTHLEELAYFQALVKRGNDTPFPMWDRDLPPSVSTQWRWLARRLLDLKIDPATYVHRHWRRRSHLMRPLYADDLISEAAISKFGSLTRSVYTEWRNEIEMQRRHFPQAVSWERSTHKDLDERSAVARVLAHRGINDYLSAFFCMCVAAQMSEIGGGMEMFDKVSRGFYEQAAIEYVRDPDAYRTVWSPLVPIPPQFLEYFDLWYRNLKECR